MRHPITGEELPIDCGCQACVNTLNLRRNRWMILCPTCGNKRCPHAANHVFVCTGSNELGQVGTVAT